MSHRAPMIGLLMAFALSGSLAAAAPSANAAARGLRIAPAAAATSFDAKTRSLLTDAVARSLAVVSVGVPVGRYAISPSLIQLRRYVDGGIDSHTSTIVCIVELTLTDAHGSILGITHGRATVVAGTAADAIEAAARAASSPIPGAIVAAERSQSNGTYARR